MLDLLRLGVVCGLPLAAVPTRSKKHGALHRIKHDTSPVSRQNSIRAQKGPDFERGNSVGRDYRLGKGYSVGMDRCVDSAKWITQYRQTQFSSCSSSTLKKDVRSSGSSSQIITMMQAAEPWHGNYPTAFARVLFCLTTGRRSLRQREMRSIFVVVTDVLIHQAFQMTSIEDDHMIEQIPAAVANPALCNTVLPRTPEAGPFWARYSTS